MQAKVLLVFFLVRQGIVLLTLSRVGWLLNSCQMQIACKRLLGAFDLSPSAQRMVDSRSTKHPVGKVFCQQVVLIFLFL